MSDEPKASTLLKQMAEMAWKAHIHGDLQSRYGKLLPMNMIFNQLRRQQMILDLEALQAATAQKVFDHISRTAEGPFKPGRTKHEKVSQFVAVFFEDLLGRTYRGNLARLLSDEKDLKAAFLFYVQAQIPEKQKGDKQ